MRDNVIKQFCNLNINDTLYHDYGEWHLHCNEIVQTLKNVSRKQNHTNKKNFVLFLEAKGKYRRMILWGVEESLICKIYRNRVGYNYNP